MVPADLLEAVATPEEMFEALGFEKSETKDEVVYTKQFWRLTIDEEEVYKVIFDLGNIKWAYFHETNYYDDDGELYNSERKTPKMDTELTKAVFKQLKDYGWL